MLKKIFLVLALVSVSFMANAASDLYSVTVSVDVTDSDSSKAREKAMVEANRAAFLQVIKKLSSNEAVNKLSNMTNNEILNFIKIHCQCANFIIRSNW